jgi:hypothetical protein
VKTRKRSTDAAKAEEALDSLAQSVMTLFMQEQVQKNKLDSQ